MERVEFVEVGPRDGFQIEKSPMATADKIGIIDALVVAGIRTVEVAAFVSPRAVPQMADAGAIVAGIDRSLGAIFRALVPNRYGALAAVDAGIDELVAFLSASESHNAANLNCSINESLERIEQVCDVALHAGVGLHGGISTAFGCPFEGDIDPGAVVEIARAMSSLGICHLTLGDTTGMATPPIVIELVRVFQDALPEMALTLHFHNTRGLGLVNVLAGLNEGIRSFEGSVGGLGGCPFAPQASGNIASEDAVNLFHELGYETGIDLAELCGVAHRVETMVGRKLEGQVMKAGPRLSLHDAADVSRAVG